MVVTFYAKKYKEMNVVLDARAVVVQDGKRIITGLNGIWPQGMAVQFHDGTFSTDDQKIIEAMYAHKGYGVRFFSDEAGEVAVPDATELQKEAEKKALSEQVRSTCPTCGKKFNNEAGLRGHMRIHSKG